MKYITLLADTFAPSGKEKVVKVTHKYGSTLMKDTIVDNLLSVLSIEFNKEKKVHTPRSFEAIADHREFKKLKDKLAMAEGDRVELGNEQLAWIRKHFSADGFSSQSSAMLVALHDLLEEAEKQDEAEAEKVYREEKDKPSMTVKEYAESLGYKVEEVAAEMEEPKKAE